MAVFGDRILRCTDGHLFVSSETSRLFGSVHLGPVRRMQCPVDGQTVAGLARELLKLSDSQLQSLRSLATAASEPAVAAMLSRMAAGRERG
jgi:hypothetical protein